MIVPDANLLLHARDDTSPFVGPADVLVTDAQIAAIALSHRAEVHTADRDFRRFSGVTCRFPLQDDAAP